MASLTDRFKYDVFLSFRGEDTRYGFTGNLKKALDDKGVQTFIDDEELQKGDEITPSLLKAIEESMMAIVVLSENYASSSFCLQELSKILNTMKDKAGRSVMPVFYKVDPSDVRKLKRSYGEAMAQHEKRSNSNMDLLQKWKDSLHQVANLSGFHYKGDGYEHEFIGKIVENVLKMIKPVALHVGDYLVGLKDKVKDVISLLNVGSDDTTQMVGIYGIGGIGKTTLALEVYNCIVNQFQGSCYLEKVRENSDNKNGLIYLQKTLLSQIVGDNNFELTSVSQGISILQQRLHKKKILLLLDDVDNERQLEAIAGRSNWFGPGSRVIITTRDQRLLTCHGVESTYEVMELNYEDSFELVRWKAFKNEFNLSYIDLKSDKNISGYADVLMRAVAYASGLPLALEVIGSHFFMKTIEQSKRAIDRCERVLDKKIQTILELSFDALQEEEKFVFLDIACCFKGYKLKRVEQILHAHHGDIMKDHIDVLVEKSLIKISEYGIVTLHDLVEDMGKQIVRRESPDPGKRSRLWSSEDIIRVLQENKGTSSIEIIHLSGSCIEAVELDGEALKKMENLKTLIFSDFVSFSENPKHLPNSLRVLECSGLNPLACEGFLTRASVTYLYLLSYINKYCLILIIYFACFSISIFFLQKFLNMRVLNLKYSHGLAQIPDISGLPNLEEFSIQNCATLIEIDKSISFLGNLKILRIAKCTEIRIIPPLMLPSLEELYISDCSNLEYFSPVIDEFVDKLKIMSVRHCIKLRSIPPLKLDSLETLELLGCYTLESFPLVVDSFLTKLKTLNVKSCRNLRSIPPLKLDSLETLELSGCDTLESFPLVVDTFLAKLKTLNVRSCRNLRSIPPLKLDSLETLELSDCHSLESFPLVVDEYLGKLKTMLVTNCLSLGSIPPLKLDSLETLKLSGCDTLESFPLVVDTFLAKLKTLNVKCCRNLRSIPPLKLDSLETLELSDCHSLESFPLVVDEYLGKLKTMLVTNCLSLRSIPPLKLDSLETLDLSCCYSLENFPLVVDGFLGKLKTMVVKNCHNLRSIPPLKLDLLEKLDLSNCFMLESFSSVGDGLLDKLKFVNIEFCIMLRSIPRLSLTSLENFNLSYCYSLKSFRNILGEMRNIRGLLLVETPIKESSFQFRNRSQLQKFHRCNCEYDNRSDGNDPKLTIMNEEKVNASNVKYICVGNVKLSDELLSKTLMLFANVKELHLTNNQLTIIPKSIEKCHFLWKLVLDDCKELNEIKGIPPCLRELSALNCKSLSSSCKSKLLNQKLHEAGNTLFRLPREKVPEWFDHQREAGMSISFWFCGKFPPITLCVVSPHTWSYSNLPVRVIINGITFFYTRGWKTVKSPRTYHLHLFHMQVEYFNGNVDKALLENNWNHAEVDFGFPFMFSGIHVLKEKCNMKDIRFTNPENDANVVFTRDEVTDLPQAMLPEPFNLSTELSSTSDEIEPLLNNLPLMSSSSENFLDNQEREAHGRENVHCCLIL